MKTIRVFLLGLSFLLMSQLHCGAVEYLPADIADYPHWTFQIANEQGRLYLLNIWTDNAQVERIEIPTGIGDSGDLLLSGNYKAGLINSSRNMMYVLPGQPGIFIATQYGSTSVSYAKAFFVQDNNLTQVQFMTADQSGHNQIVVSSIERLSNSFF